MVECFGCGKSTVVTSEEARLLDCDGTHFMRVGEELVPVFRKGLRIGANSTVRKIDNGIDVIIGSFCDLYKCKIGDFTKIKNYVEIQEAQIGECCKIQSYVFIPTGVTIGDCVFIGARTTFINDIYPSVGEYELKHTVIEDNVSIGTGAIIFPVTIGKGALIGAGALVTKSIPPGVIAYGCPAKVVREYAT